LGLGELPKSLIYIVSGLLFVGALPLPYGYYMLLRLVVCGIFAWAAYITYERKKDVLPWVFGILAIMFNPIMKIHLPKELWAVVDVCSGIFLLAVSTELLPSKEAKTY
jgi:hypothetical protein